jgi:hypothetical protein
MNNTTTHIDLKGTVEVCPDCHDTGIVTIDGYDTPSGEHTQYEATCMCQLADLIG